MSAISPNDPTRSALLSSLASVRRKAKVLSVVFGVGLVLSAALASLLLIILVDYFVRLPVVPRAVFIVVAASALSYLLWTYVARPVMARLSLGDVAGHVENTFPQLDDRLRSTVSFAGGDVPGSDVMKCRVLEQTGHMMGSIDLNSVLVRRPVLYSMLSLVVAAGLLSLLLWGLRDDAWTALSRALGLSNKGYLKTVQIDARPLPAKVAAGQSFPVRMRITKGEKAGLKAMCYFRYDDGSVQRMIMNREDDGTYSASVVARGNMTKVWMTAGDDETEPQSIPVVAPLRIMGVEARVVPPPYCKLDPVSYNLSQPAMVTIGSTVALHVSFNKPLDPGKPVVVEKVRPDMNLPAMQWKPATSNVPVGTFIANESIRFRIHATDTRRLRKRRP